MRTNRCGEIRCTHKLDIDHTVTLYRQAGRPARCSIPQTAGAGGRVPAATLRRASALAALLVVILIIFFSVSLVTVAVVTAGLVAITDRGRDISDAVKNNPEY
jgi:hypothetical protein